MSLTSQDKDTVGYKCIQKVPNTELRTFHPAPAACQIQAYTWQRVSPPQHSLYIYRTVRH